MRTGQRAIVYRYDRTSHHDDRELSAVRLAAGHRRRPGLAVTVGGLSL
jgi:hypothetical protein